MKEFLLLSWLVFSLGFVVLAVNDIFFHVRAVWGKVWEADPRYRIYITDEWAVNKKRNAREKYSLYHVSYGEGHWIDGKQVYYGRSWGLLGRRRYRCSGCSKVVPESILLQARLLQDLNLELEDR